MIGGSGYSIPPKEIKILGTVRDVVELKREDGVNNMQFIPKLKEFLKENGFIYTVRGYDMDHRWVSVEDVGWCERFPLGLIKELGDIEPFADKSGFDTLDDWIKMIRVFIKEGKSAWLYKVVIREREV